MKPTGLIDLHCDTLTAGLEQLATSQELTAALTTGEGRDALLGRIVERDSLDDPVRAASLSKLRRGTKWAQCYAIFIPDQLRGALAWAYFEANCAGFYRQMEKFSDRVRPCRSSADITAAFASGRFAALLTVEGGAVLGGDLARVEQLAQRGVRMLTLVWNGENELGSGILTDKGLTPFGGEAVSALERCGILVDVSHLNDAGFSTVLEVAKRPFVASHSNARAVAAHRRNLTDGQIVEMVRRSCLIGLNYYVAFLREDSDVRSLDDLYRHVCHFLELGAGDILALGSDFDGADLPDCLDSLEKSLTIYDYLLSRGIAQRQADAILFHNAWRFFEENL